MTLSTSHRWGLILNFCIALQACSYEDKLQPQGSPTKEDHTSEVYTLHPRDPRLPKYASSPKHNARTLPSSIERVQFTPLQYLGYGYRVGSGIIGLPDNVSFPVFDRDKILQDPDLSDYITLHRLRYASSEVNMSTKMDYSLEYKKEVETVNTGFHLNLGLFSVGASHHYTDTFSSFIERNKTYAKGELNLFWYETKVNLLSSDYALHRICSKHLSKSFVDHLYNASMSDILKSYGPFVLLGYYTGGRATSLYLLEKDNRVHDDSWEHIAKSSIGLDYAWTLPVDPKNPNAPDSLRKANVHLHIGYNENNDKRHIVSDSCKSVIRQTSIYGGARDLAYSIPPQETKESFTDLGPWFRSLADEKTHTLVDIASGGLVGLDKIILERNFKVRMSRLLNKSIERTTLSLPYVVICYIRHGVIISPSAQAARAAEPPMHYRPQFPPGTRTSPSEPSDNFPRPIPLITLRTRHDDQILILDEDMRDRINRVYSHPKGTQEDDEIQRLDSLCTTLFRCEIKINKGTPSYDPLSLSPYNGIFPIRFHLFNPSGYVFKYKNPDTGIWYIYDRSYKTAFSFVEDSEIPDIYGIEDWIESIPERPISMKLLSGRYGIIGL